MPKPRFTWKIMPGITLPDMEAVKDFLGERVLHRTAEPLDNPTGSDADLSEWDDPEYLPATHADATLVTSDMGDGMHMPTIDIDHECMLIPSSKPGRYHLYINVPMTKKKYFALLNALVVAGIVEPGYYAHSLRRGRSFLRYPGVTKHNEAQRIEETREAG